MNSNLKSYIIQKALLEAIQYYQCGNWFKYYECLQFLEGVE